MDIFPWLRQEVWVKGNIYKPSLCLRILKAQSSVDRGVCMCVCVKIM